MPRRDRCRGASYPSQKQNEEQEQQPSLPACWKSLPLELRELVFEYLEDSVQSGKVKASTYAMVCKEWYDYFEPCIFRRLTLSIQRLNELEAIIIDSRRSFVQHIWFRFERSIRPGVTPVAFRHEMDGIRFAAAMFQLFQILSEWPERIAGQPGITLELTAFSVVDPEDSMKDTVPDELRDVDLTVDSETLNAIYEKTPNARRTLTDNRARRHGELQDFYDPRSHFILESMRLPKVQLITDLTMRRQMHISFFTNYIKHMLNSLPNLEFLTYEPHVLHKYAANSHDNSEAVRSILTKMPSSIRRLQVFEGGPGLYHYGSREMWVSDRDGSLGRLVADVSQDKQPEVISMSFVIDAVDFFSDFRTPEISRPHWKLGWLNLTSLVLTSAILMPQRKEEIPEFLIAAARAARHMPKLEIMELYYVAKREGSIFAYIHDDTSSILCWDSTWKWEFLLDIISEWKEAADVHGAKVFDYEENMIQLTDEFGSKSDSSILSLLRTRTTVVHPITYGNMMEGRNFM